MLSYRDDFIELNSELFHLLERVGHEHLNYMELVEIIGGKEVRDDIQHLFENYSNFNNDNNDNYAEQVIIYFRNNSHKHDEWISRLKLHIL